MTPDEALADYLKRKKRKPITDPFFCPLCGFLLADDLDGHFVPCLVGRTLQVDFNHFVSDLGLLKLSKSDLTV
jgi:hypothetical protein